jgi:hypothetical protein
MNRHRSARLATGLHVAKPGSAESRSTLPKQREVPPATWDLCAWIPEYPLEKSSEGLAAECSGPPYSFRRTHASTSLPGSLGADKS